MFRFKFYQNLTKNEEFDFFEGQEGGEEEVDLHFKIVLSFIFGKYMKMFLFKFDRNRTIIKNYFFEGGEGGKKGNPNSKFHDNCVMIKKCVSNSIKIAPKMNNLTFLRGRGRRFKF